MFLESGGLLPESRLYNFQGNLRGGYFGKVQGKKLGRGSYFYARDVPGDPLYCLRVYCANNSSDMISEGIETRAKKDNQVEEGVKNSSLKNAH